ncbi:D-Ala-D-Ala carboxypeptidase [Megasphaera cerevisiae DSM 20462]|uniref:D-Ala-D-Ala carboxypeptidase n=1 Tax=Megasphaera cerevisiae DSM 20462 TaxID=1122219 RepID=A0A0J6WXC5_9FIRM|nr:D-alanyl-D-alanine carboxypeptidase family protein [Megasphaera cerevisiae]KMO87274.1 D-Ala-D-Ala carboxypeptidase [Megasphaera cerevisiae DSM 20462]SJZ49255.1 D-alanyl-D-alanine carboxypeptidase (penicillin-binding protein 5/6) [Megasphaera cerevisiae DSM 20462]
MFSYIRHMVSAAVFMAAFMICTAAFASVQAAVPSTIAESACMIDVDSGKILYQVNPTKWIHPASTTKIVTLITALDQGKDKLDQPLNISQEAADTEPSVLGIAPGDRLTVREALRGMMVVSGNDAAVAVAETLGGSVAGYAGMMNNEAVKMGAAHSHFVNPNGLTAARHYTTAVDMAKMAAYGMKNFPEFRYIVSLPAYDVKYLDGRPSKHVTTTNRFLISGYAGADGVKTGFTNAAGDCLVAAATRNGHTLVLALFNDDDRWEDAPAILDYGFRRLQTGK